MAKITSSEFVAAAREVQQKAVQELGTQPHIAIVRMHNPAQPGYYAPTASYAAQIRNHAAQIGVESSEHVLFPGEADKIAGVVERLSQDERVTGIMPLYPLSMNRAQHRERAAAVKDTLAHRPSLDVDDLLGQGNRAPTARAMVAMGNICLAKLAGLNSRPYFVDRTLDEISTLELPTSFPTNNIRLGGRGELTGGPLVSILASQGIHVPDAHVATVENPGALKNLPQPALVFTATPVAEQIRDEDIPRGSVMVDAGFGVVDGQTYGNTDRRAAARPDVLWTPPREGVGPVSTVYLHHHLLESAGYPPAEMPALGFVALEQSIDYAVR